MVVIVCVCVCAAGAEQARGGAASSKLAAGSAGSSWQGVGARLGRLQQVSSTLHGCFVCILGYSLLGGGCGSGRDGTHHPCRLCEAGYLQWHRIPCNHDVVCRTTFFFSSALKGSVRMAAATCLPAGAAAAPQGKMASQQQLRVAGSGCRTVAGLQGEVAGCRTLTH